MAEVTRCKFKKIPVWWTISFLRWDFLPELPDFLHQQHIYSVLSFSSTASSELCVLFYFICQLKKKIKHQNQAEFAINYGNWRARQVSAMSSNVNSQISSQVDNFFFKVGLFAFFTEFWDPRHAGHRHIYLPRFGMVYWLFKLIFGVS